MTTAPSRPVLRYHGSKWRLAPWIASFFPVHTRYVETHGGGAGVLLRKERSHSEVYNDLDGEVARFFRTLRNPETRGALAQSIAFTPFARSEFDAAYEPTDDDVEAARRMLVRSHLGFGTAAVTHGQRSGCRVGVTRTGTTPAQDWRAMPDIVRAAGERMMGVDIETRPASQLLARWKDDPDTLWYVDPPYVPETRQNQSDCYRHEASADDHRALAEQLRAVAGPVVLSGYRSPLYDVTLFPDWHRVERVANGNGQKGGAPRLECLWLSPTAAARLADARPASSLFASAA